MTAQHFRSTPRDHRGFTLVELTITLAVVAIVFAIAAPRFNESDSQRRAEMAADRIERDIRMAEQNAWHTGRELQVVFDVANDSYEIVGLTDASGNPYVVDLTAAPYKVSLGSVDFGGSDTLTIDGRGGVPATGSIVLADGGFSTAVSVAPVDVESLTMDVSDRVSTLANENGAAAAAAAVGAK